MRSIQRSRRRITEAARVGQAYPLTLGNPALTHGDNTMEVTQEHRIEMIILLYKTLPPEGRKKFFKELDLFGEGACIYDSLQTVGIYHADTRLLDLLSSDGVMVLPNIERYEEDQDSLDSDVNDCIKHFLKAYNNTEG